MLKRLFPTLSRPNKDCGVLEWATLALAIILVFAVVGGLAGEILYQFGYYDQMLKDKYGMVNPRDGWTPDD